MPICPLPGSHRRATLWQIDEGRKGACDRCSGRTFAFMVHTSRHKLEAWQPGWSNAVHGSV